MRKPAAIVAYVFVGGVCWSGHWYGAMWLCAAADTYLIAESVVRQSRKHSRN